jgi:16S rRNA (adenine1518-N6/adenine1519-N6)-dimethyltransferase
MTAYYRTLREHGVRSDKRLGQHILVDQAAIERIVDAADLDRTDVVLEVGPGPGTLTVPLAERAGQVVAVELDERMLAPLQELLRDRENVAVVHGDILDQDVASLVGEGRYKVVANLPYYVTSAVLRHVLEARVRPERLVVTVQREVAERIVGRPGRGQRRRKRTSGPRMSLLAVSVQFYGEPRIVARIPAGAFRPVPAVDSAVVRVNVYNPLPWGQVDVRRFFEVARAGFAQSRKQLRNALIHNLGLSADRVSAGLEAAGIDGRRRAETLSVPEWVALSRAL